MSDTNTGNKTICSREIDLITQLCSSSNHANCFFGKFPPCGKKALVQDLNKLSWRALCIITYKLEWSPAGVLSGLPPSLLTHSVVWFDQFSFNAYNAVIKLDSSKSDKISQHFSAFFQKICVLICQISLCCRTTVPDRGHCTRVVGSANRADSLHCIMSEHAGAVFHQNTARRQHSTIIKLQILLQEGYKWTKMYGEGC